MSIETCTILLYLFIAVLITVNLGNMLYRKGAVLLHYIFYKEEEWAKPVNKIMLIGFYLLNIGIATLYYNQGIQLDSYLEAFNFLSSKIGGLLVIIGGMHIFNVLFFLVIKWEYLTVKPRV
jgi:hypothetical protein